MKILIVEDSRLARRELANLLRAHPEHTLVGEAGDLRSALELVGAQEPDLLLLDIHLPDGSGFELLEQVERVPGVIFTTAYDQHALRAFEVNALDYLLKPITAERLARALDKVAGENARRHSAEAEERAPGTAEHLFLRDGERCHFVRFDEIRLLEVIGNHVRLYYRNERAMLGRSLNYVEARLDARRFFRANRQQIVNLDYIAAVEPWIGEGLLLKLSDGGEVEVSRRQARELRQRLEL